MSLTTVPELSLPMSARLKSCFLLHIAMSGQSILYSAGNRCANSISIAVMDRDFQVHDCLHLQQCSDYYEGVLGMSWKKCRAAGSPLFNYRT